ncbi:MAG: hypothetical protein LBI42_03200 [Chitinispirillales bacterium]|jgi:hypothetical protein|nr:hypothetical protein [Chitinispirillales bacterium]
MKKLLSAAIFTVITAVYAQGVGVPPQNMTSNSVAVEYNVMMIGHPDLYNFDAALPIKPDGSSQPEWFNFRGSSLVSHMARLHYSPVRFIRFSAGIGGSHAYSDPKITGVDISLSATGGAALYLPKLLSVLSLTAGYDGYYLKYSELDTLHWNQGGDIKDSKYYQTKDGRTSGTMHVPYASLILHPSHFVDIEIGARYNVFKVNKEVSCRSVQQLPIMGYDKDNNYVVVDSGFFYTEAITQLKGEFLEQFRVHGSITLHDPKSKAYLNLGLSAAPNIEKKDKTNTWLTRSSIWASIGISIKDAIPCKKKKSAVGYSGSYIELKQMQEEMAQELLDDFDHTTNENEEEYEE